MSTPPGNFPRCMPSVTARRVNLKMELPVHVDRQGLDVHGFDAAFGGARRDGGKVQGHGARVLVPLGNTPVGSQEPETGTLVPLQHPAAAPGNRSASFPCRTGPSSIFGTTSTWMGSGIVPLCLAVTPSGCRNAPCQSSVPRAAGRSRAPFESSPDTVPAVIRGDARIEDIRENGPADRPRPVGIDGKDETRGLLLMALAGEVQGSAALSDLRQCRRRQIDAHRAPAQRTPSASSRTNSTMLPP